MTDEYLVGESGGLVPGPQYNYQEGLRRRLMARRLREQLERDYVNVGRLDEAEEEDEYPPPPTVPEPEPMPEPAPQPAQAAGGRRQQGPWYGPPGVDFLSLLAQDDSAWPTPRRNRNN
jgi:hypothetical protein